MAIWHDVESAGEPDYNLWHTREHMAERVSIPGFRLGRRWVDWNLDRHRYFTLYEAATVDVFGSEPYRARLNAPSAWTQRIQPHITNVVRSACRTIVSVGSGIGGALATVRLTLTPGSGAGAFATRSDALAHAILPLHGVTSVHVGSAEPSVTGVRTKESELRRSSHEDVFDAVVLIDGIGRRELERVLPQIDVILSDRSAGIGSKDMAVYDLAYALAADEI